MDRPATGATPLPDVPWRTPPRRAEARVALGRDTIVDAALRILDGGGADELTMRRVANELGVSPGSLYGYVADKEELVELLIDRIFLDVPVPDAGAGDWTAELRRFMDGIRAAFGRRPGTAGLLLGRVPFGPHFIERLEGLLAVLRQGGVPDQAAAWAGDLIGLYVAAFCQEEARRSRAGGGGPGSTEAQVEALRGWIGTLPAERLPHITATLPLVLGGGSDARFAWGVEVLTRGIASFAAVAAPRP